MDKLHLRITIDPNAGFCFGVIYAIEMAESVLEEQGYLYCLGDIVHNDEEIKRLATKGLRVIDHRQLATLRHEKVLIRAHGEPPATYALALKNHLELIDASCPVILKLQNRIKNSSNRGERIYIYGKADHPEVVGLLGQTGNQAVVFQDVQEFALDKLPARVTLYSQTTKSPDKFYEVTQALRNAGVEVEAHDTICRQVANRDKELRVFAKRFNRIIFVAGAKSSNGKALYQACKESNPNTYFVSADSEIHRAWFKAQETVGICGATSTPMWLLEQIRDELLTY